MNFRGSCPARACLPFLCSGSLLAVTLLSAVLFATGCGDGSRASRVASSGTPSTEGPAAALLAQHLAQAVRAQERATPVLMEAPGVIGTGATLDADGEPRVVVLLESDDGVMPMPGSVEGIPIDVWVVGEIRPWSLTASYRPMAVGVSVGHANECLPGTIGCVLERGTKRFVLSANHVLARQNLGVIGEAIVQPSLPDIDAACAPAPPSAVVATLSDFQSIVYDGKTPNTMDAAIAEIALSPSQFVCSTPPGYYGFPSATVATASAGLRVMKLGRTTELTRAVVKAVNVRAKITFPSGVALFTGQILTGPGFGDFGDSGALVVTDDGTRRPVGIVIGGGTNGSAIVSPIGPILTRFSASVCDH